MYFQCCGLSDAAASFVVSVSWVTAMLVSPVVGRVSDAAARRFEDRGRAALAQGALALRAMLMLTLLRGLEPHPKNFGGFVVLSALVGLMAGWPGVGANRPVLTEIVMPQHRATAFALVSGHLSIHVRERIIMLLAHVVAFKLCFRCFAGNCGV